MRFVLYPALPPDIKKLSQYESLGRVASHVGVSSKTELLSALLSARME